MKGENTPPQPLPWDGRGVKSVAYSHQALPFTEMGVKLVTSSLPSGGEGVGINIRKRAYKYTVELSFFKS